MRNVFVLQFSHRLPNGEDSGFLLGVYSSQDHAKKAFEILKLQPGFSEHPRIIDPLTEDDNQGFTIDSYTLNEICWKDGFTTITSAEHMDMGVYAKINDCEAHGGIHKWYNHDGKHSACYHCNVVRDGQLWKE